MIPTCYEKVYVMTFLPTGKKYVGKTTQMLKYRLSSHLSALRHGVHSSKELQKDFNEHGGTIDNFKMEYMGKQVLRRDLHMDKERELMVQLKTYDPNYGYNVQDHSMRKYVRENGL